MTHDKATHDDQMSALMEHAMDSVTASEELVSGSVRRGQRAVRRRRTAQAFGIGAVASLATVAAIAAPSFLGAQEDPGSSVASGAAAADSGAASETTRQPAPQPMAQPTAGALAPGLQRAQDLLLDAIPKPIPNPGYIARVDYDPDGRGLGEILAVVSIDDSMRVDGQGARCDRAAASPASDDCIETDDGWIFTDPSLPDVSGKDPELAGVRATYILRNGKGVTLNAYNATKAALGGVPTRIDPVLDADDMVELITKTDWFS